MITKRTCEETRAYNISQLTLILDFLQHASEITQKPNEPNIMYSIQTIGGLTGVLTMGKRDFELLSQARGSLWSPTVLPGHEIICVLVARLVPAPTVVRIGPLMQGVFIAKEVHSKSTRT